MWLREVESPQLDCMVLTKAGNGIGTKRRQTYHGALPLHFIVRPQTSCVRQLLLLGYR